MLASPINPAVFNASDFDKATRGERLFVAETDSEIVGFVSVWEPENFIHHLYVLPEYQGRGVGTLLHHAAVQVLAKPVELKCLSHNKRALSFYRKLGWKTVGSGVDADGEYLLLRFA